MQNISMLEILPQKQMPETLVENNFTFMKLLPRIMCETKNKLRLLERIRPLPTQL